VLESSLLIPLALLLGLPAPLPATPEQVPRILLQVAEPIYTGPPAASSERLGLPSDFPTKIWVQEGLRELVGEMWHASPTFRRQCLQVQAAGAIQVQLRLDSQLATSPSHRAMCELRLYERGGLIARLSVAPIRIPELIGHEMEHVCERLDGVKVEERSKAHAAGFYLIDPSHNRYETDRAIRVGRQVLAETEMSGSVTRIQTQP